tara:strand:+ start:19 stop:393 length:375 start_codon:yes stop_codon:yes gene_type:complete
MEDKTAEATDSLSKDTGGIVGLDRPLDSLDLPKILAKEFEEQEQESEERDELGKRGIVMPIMFRRKGDYCSRLSLLNLFEIKFRKKTPTKPHEIMIEKHKNGDVDGPATNNIPRLSILKKSPES